MISRRLHKTLGLLLLLPLLAWGATGIVFYFKPGYGDAYEQLTPKFYPLKNVAPLIPENSAQWLKATRVQTQLGQHLLVNTADGVAHLNASTGAEFSQPTDAQLRAFINDAIAHNPARYGQVIEREGDVFTTNTGVVITLDWPRLQLRQRGPDTELIDTLYRIHYLQWSGFKTFDRVFGLLGIALLFSLSLLGFWLYLQHRRRTQRPTR